MTAFALVLCMLLLSRTPLLSGCIFDEYQITLSQARWRPDRTAAGVVKDPTITRTTPSLPRPPATPPPHPQHVPQASIRSAPAEGRRRVRSGWPRFTIIRVPTKARARSRKPKRTGVHGQFLRSTPRRPGRGRRMQRSSTAIWAPCRSTANWVRGDNDPARAGGRDPARGRPADRPAPGLGEAGSGRRLVLRQAAQVHRRIAAARPQRALPCFSGDAIDCTRRRRGRTTENDGDAGGAACQYLVEHDYFKMEDNAALCAGDAAVAIRNPAAVGCAVRCAKNGSAR